MQVTARDKTHLDKALIADNGGSLIKINNAV